MNVLTTCASPPELCSFSVSLLHAAAYRAAARWDKPENCLCLQAVEAKEGVEIQNETVTLASISYQNFFRSYPVCQALSHMPVAPGYLSCSLAFIMQPKIRACCLQKLAGMTGTAATEAAEFSNIYKLEVTEVPTNKPLSRTDNPDVVFRSEAGGPSRSALQPLAMLLTPAVCTFGHVRALYLSESAQ